PRGIAAVLGAALTVRDDNRQARAGHAGQQYRWRFHDLDLAEASLELFDAIAHEAWPVLGTGDQFLQRRHHLAAVADTECEGVCPLEEARELLTRARIEQDGFGPSLTGAQHIAIGESAAGDEA